MGYREVVLADRPTGYWRLNDCAVNGATAHDLAGNNSATGGSLGAPLQWHPIVGDPTSGTVGFLGAASKIGTIGLQPNLNADFTFEAWVLPTANGTSMPIISSTATGAPYWMWDNRNDADGLCLQYDLGAGAVFVPAGSSFITSQSLPPYNHALLTRQGNTWTTWINGVATKTATNSVNTIATTTINIGNLPIGTNVWTGQIAEVAIYAYALSQQTILRHYAVGRGIGLAQPDRRRRGR